MILIFGGTTEGRIASQVCEEAGKRYYYSTKGGSQDVSMPNGVRLSGSMTHTEILHFCHENDIRCIIDAAHPFAENLHREIALTRMPVIRIQRDTLPIDGEGVFMCDDYDDAISKMVEHKVVKLLALSGANTIAKLKTYWCNHATVFRILNREDSIAKADEAGLSRDSLIFYNDNLLLPSADEERMLMQQVGCDAILTKQSGNSGGFDAKVEAALSLGLKVFVVKAPSLPYPWTYVGGRNGLRRAIEELVPSFFDLHTGLTTGACATAAAKAAAISLLCGDCPEEVSFALPDGEVMAIEVDCNTPGTATVTKPHNDDPDVTKGCRITAKVTTRQGESEQTIHFLQGDGVGVVTLPGLGIPVGEPAINPTPRRMIETELRSLSEENFDITISVEGGAELALKTFNHKVGVVGGISIIGTSGIVRPLSNEAFIQSIRRELEVARAIGCREIGLVAGMKSEHSLQREQPELRCVHYGNYVGEALLACRELGFECVTLAIMIGKAVKLAEGHLDTHSHKVSMNKEFLLSIAPDYAEQIEGITMARQLWEIMPLTFFETITRLCHHHCCKVFKDGKLKIKLICDKNHS